MALWGVAVVRAWTRRVARLDLVPLVLSLVLVVVYAPALRYGWVYDDANWLPSDAGPSWAMAPYRWANALGQGLPWAFHALGLGLHLLNGWLLWAVGRPWLSRAGLGVALALFWLHPIQVEAVAYVSGTLDAVIATYVLFAVWLWRDHVALRLVAAVLIGLALTVKWSALPIVGALIAVNGRRVSWRWLTAGVALFALVLLHRYGVAALDVTREPVIDVGHRVVLTAAGITQGLLWILWPASLGAEHPPLMQPVVLALAWAALGIVAWRVTATWRAWVWISVLLLARAISPESRAITEHHWYLPGIALWLLAGAGVDMTVSKGFCSYGRSTSVQHC